jgi:hypothetical protein
MVTLFVLVPAGHSVLEVLPPDGLLEPRLEVRSYPRADNRAHLLSLVRAGRDRTATGWRGGLAISIAAGSLLGLTTATILAASFDMFGGLVGLAIGFGSAVGAFLGGFTAAMTGTERARSEVKLLADSVRTGDVLAQLGPFHRDDPRLLAVRLRCDELHFARTQCE